MVSESNGEFGSEFLDEPEAAVQAHLAASAFGPLAARQESIAQILVEDANLEKLSHFRSWVEPVRYGLMNYLLVVVKTVGQSGLPLLDAEGQPVLERVVDATGEHLVPIPRGYRPPPLETHLVKPDLQYRDSFHQETRKHLRDITKIFERGDSGKRGGLFRR